ncbi:MAG: metal-dependent transcriptional regulator [Candidatus Omnitrophota bacterium]
MITDMSPSLEDALEGVLIVQQKNDVVRVKDLAQLLKVKASSVIESLAKLKKSGFIEHEPYGLVKLTPKGLSSAKRLYERHVVLKTFFHQVLGVQEPVAEEDACKIEHHLSEKTTQRLFEFIKNIDASVNRKDKKVR